MKKILAVCLLVASASAFANGQHGHHGHHNNGYYGGHNNWIAPLIIGGVVGYAINRPSVVYTPPVAYPPVTTIPTVQSQSCTPWVEYQNPDGSIYRTRTCSQ